MIVTTMLCPLLSLSIRSEAPLQSFEELDHNKIEMTIVVYGLLLKSILSISVKYVIRSDEDIQFSLTV